MKKVITSVDVQKGYQIQNITPISAENTHHFENDVKHEKKHRTPFELLEDLDLIGCFEGEKTLAKKYKKTLSKYLAKKHG